MTNDISIITNSLLIFTNFTPTFLDKDCLFINFPYFFTNISSFLNTGFNIFYNEVSIMGFFEFESKQERHLLFGLVGVLLIVAGITFYPSAKAYVNGMITGRGAAEKTVNVSAGIELQKTSKTPSEYYSMFQCSCCGQPIDAGCCGMAKQRKDYLDKLLLEGLSEDELVYRMVKKFGFDVLMEQSMEQQVREYMKSIAPENPPRIEIDSPRYDFGTVSQTDGIVSTSFTIRNTGGSDLVIENIDTSCMCTTASLVYKGQESPRFSMSMHGKNPENFEMRIPAGETAQLRVYYDPNAHGKQKKPEIRVIREVTIISNDPTDFQKEVRITVRQVP
jgi:hypothetical protein